MKLVNGFLVLILSAFLICGAANASGGKMTAEDERAITALLLRYATAIDTRDWTMFGNCFTKDAVVDYDGVANLKGREAVVEFMSTGISKLGNTLHRMSNMVIEGDAAHATATTYVDAVRLEAAPDGMVLQAIGRYEDKLVHERDGWKIASRHFIPLIQRKFAR
jgi:ketosteroid isomerase-like protein